MDGSVADFLRLARKRYQHGVDADRLNRDRDHDDREFYKGGECQWSDKDRGLRVGRPTITVNRLPQFVKQVTGEMEQNKPAIKVLPVDDQTDPKLAEVYSAIIRHIESNSDAHRIYAKSGKQAAIGGIGWFRILTEYLDDSFEQEIVVDHIRNPMSVVIDPDAIKPTRQDMKWAFIAEMMSKEAFEAAFPDASTVGFDVDSEYADWVGEDKIRVAEYWVKEPVERELLLLTDGSTRYFDEIDPSMLEMMGVGIRDRRKVESHRVRWYRMTGNEVLDEGEWSGKFVPLVPVIGEEVEVGDEIFRHGMIHHAKDPQRAYNFARSAMIEHVASQPKAPYLVTTKMIANHKDQWQNLNTGNPPALLYDPDPEAPGGKPTREAPPTLPTAWYQEAETADNDMKATTGIYDASLGQSGNETSGRAIMARDQQGETANFVYMDNLVAAIRMCGRILLDLIPHIYSDERVIRIIGEDGEIEGYSRINQRLPDGMVFNDISVGQFDLEVTTGPSYATKRLEAADSMMAFMQAVPAAAGVIGDLVAKNMDWPGADKIAERLKKILPPGIDDEQQQMPPEAMQMLQQSKQVIEQLGAENEQLKQDKSLEAAKLGLDAQGRRIDAYKAETDRAQAVAPQIDPAQLEPIIAKIVQDMLNSPDISRVQ